MPAPTPATHEELIAAAPVRRRAFLGWFGIGGTTAAVAATALPAKAARNVTTRLLNRGQFMLNDVTQAEFAACIGQNFQLEIAPGQTLPAILGEATLLKHTQTPGQHPERRAPFSLVFQVPVDSPLPQQIYALEHSRLGRLEIFLVPVGREAGNLLLEAIFN